MKRWRIITPQGWFVPGMLGKTKEEVWEKYTKVMGQSREDLEIKGYQASPAWGRVLDRNLHSR